MQTNEEATVYAKELDIFLTVKVFENTPAVLSLGKFCDENGYSYDWINFKKPHLINNGIRIQCNTQNLFLSWFQACERVLLPVLIIQLHGHLQDRRGIVLHLLQARLLHQRQQHQVIVRLEREDRTESDTSSVLVSSFNVDDSHASSSHEASSEPIFKRREDLGTHSVYTHFPQDQNCEICKRTKITRAPCRRRNGGAVPRAEIFGDLITADHKVLSENCESRKQSPICSRGAGLGQPKDPVVSVQNKNFTENTEKLAKVLGAR